MFRSFKELKLALSYSHISVVKQNKRSIKVVACFNGVASSLARFI
ncbi:hypothetical protein [Clostridium novyi]|nr:hypothetical protein [Clostridium novyi]